MSQTNNVVTIYHNQAFTTTLVIAEKCQIPHKRAIALVRKYSSEFEELNKGILDFSDTTKIPAEIIDNEWLSHGDSERQSAGRKTIVAILNEDQAAFLILLFKNNPVTFKFKLTLLKEFRSALEKINRLYAEPQRTHALKDKRSAHNPMMFAMQEQRADQGKDMRDDIYWRENMLCNFMVIGRFIAVCKIGGEDGLTNYEVEMLSQVRKRNECYILAGLEYKERKAKLIEFRDKYRLKHIDPQPRLPLLELV